MDWKWNKPRNFWWEARHYRASHQKFRGLFRTWFYGDIPRLTKPSRFPISTH